MRQMIASIAALRARHTNRPLIASHKGRNSGLVAESTHRAFQLALREGADILETDVSRSKDGEMILMHGPNLDRYTDHTGPICEKTIFELRRMHSRACNGCTPDVQLLELDDFLAAYKGRCLINLDRCFDFIPETYEKIRAHRMEDQVLLKSSRNLEAIFDWLMTKNGEPQFMPIVDNNEDHLRFVLETARYYAYPAVELVFAEDTHPMISPDTVDRFHALGIKIWVNSLTLHFPLCGGHDDIRSLFDDPDQGWGWLCERGVDVIQTDFVREAQEYLDRRYGREG